MRTLVATFALISCSTVQGADEAVLVGAVDNHPIDPIVDNPAGSDGLIVQMEIYPYDNGYTDSYLFCLEPCSVTEIEFTPFIIYTFPRRFEGADGSASVSVRARFDAGCYTGHNICVDASFATFTEVE